MRLTKLECRSFRKLEEVCFEPSPGLNVIRGGNAQGKTTVLEALLYAATSKSHRTASEGELARHGGSLFHTHAWASRKDRAVDIEANWWNGIKRFKVNGVAQTRLSDILGRINVVFFYPGDVELVKGGAAMRRRFLDMELSQIHPPYLIALQKFRQALRQRNELLRADRPDTDMIALWDVQLAEQGAQLIDGRHRFIGELAVQAKEAYARVADGEELLLSYRPDVAESGELADALAKSLDKDIRRRVTNRGPHRDDMDIAIEGHSARNYGSQGQQKTAALAIKLAEAALVKARTGEHPILMLDEVLAELDGYREKQLLDSIDSGAQCIMTTTAPRPLPGEPLSTSAAFRIHEGRLEKE